MKFRFYIFFILTTIPALFSAVQAQTPGKTSFNLFHPVPAQYMRDMETDRPDVTESPYTLDAGHILYEADFIRLEREKGEMSEQHTNLFNKGNLKLGITSSTAFQFGFETFVWQKERAEDGEITKGHGIGDITLRIKQNIVGNNGGNFILAILPYVKIPTAKYTEDSKYEGGIIVPMMVRLPGEWRLAGQVEAERLYNSDAHAMHTELLQSLTISHELFKNLDGIAETYYTYDFNAHHWSNFLNASAQLKISPNFALDAGLNYGLQTDAMKSYFMGTSFRF